MARTPISPSQRAANVGLSAQCLPGLVEEAISRLKAYGPTDSRTLAAWENVETHGAVIHRQSRLLAGKSKGG